MKKPATKTASIDLGSVYWLVSLAFLTIAAYLLVIAPANAGVLCVLAGYALGNFGRGLATLGVLGVGIGATLGKVSWTMAVTVAVGISIMFGAAGIAGTLGGGC